MSQVFGETAALMMAVFIMVSTFGCNNGLILAGARVYYAMSLDKLFLNSAAKLNKSGVPAAALVFQGIWSSLLCLSGTYSDLLDYVVFVVLIFYAMTIGGIFILRKKRPDAERPYKAFGYPVVPALYILSALVIVSILIFYKPNYTLSGLAIVLMGIPVYYYWRWRNSRRENDSNG
jgi:APA family basic amino acid/polyamine antiporter